MRPTNDILRDVIEALEPRATLPSGMPGWSPLRLWRFDGRAPACSWAPATNVDTAELIDAAWHARQYEVITSRTLTSSSFLAGVLDRSASDNRSTSRQIGMARADTTREAVILALAQALGVEREESQ